MLNVARDKNAKQQPGGGGKGIQEHRTPTYCCNNEKESRELILSWVYHLRRRAFYTEFSMATSEVLIPEHLSLLCFSY